MGARNVLELGRRKAAFHDFILQDCGIVEAAPAGKAEAAPAYRLYFGAAGRGRIVADGAESPLGRGDGLAVRPGQRLEFRPEGEWSYFWIGFGGDRAEEGLRLAGLENTAFFRCAGCDELLSIVRKMLSHGDGGPENELLLQSLLFRFFARLAHQRISGGEQKGGRDRQYVEKAVAYIKSHYGAGITVGDIANYVSLNRSYLSTLFQRVLEVSPQDYLIFYRLARAKELLISTEDTVASVALRCGYADPQVFTRAFKQQMGMTPVNFRRSMRQQRETAVPALAANPAEAESEAEALEERLPEEDFPAGELPEKEIFEGGPPAETLPIEEETPTRQGFFMEATSEDDA